MPDKFMFDHLPDRGQLTHRCVDCGWPMPDERFVSDKERAKHHRTHARERERTAEKRRLENLAAAQSAQRLKLREAAIVNERFGAPTEGGTIMAADETATEAGKVAAELEAALKALPAKLVEKKAYHRIDQNGVTLGYVYLGVRKPSVEVPTGHGGYDRISLSTSADIPVVLTALSAVAERAAAKKAESAQPKATTTKTKAPSKTAKADVEVTPNPKPSRSRKSRAKASA